MPGRRRRWRVVANGQCGGNADAQESYFYNHENGEKKEKGRYLLDSSSLTGELLVLRILLMGLRIK